jgi:hypothetical protein
VILPSAGTCRSLLASLYRPTLVRVFVLYPPRTRAPTSPLVPLPLFRIFLTHFTFTCRRHCNILTATNVNNYCRSFNVTPLKSHLGVVRPSERTQRCRTGGLLDGCCCGDLDFLGYHAADELLADDDVAPGSNAVSSRNTALNSSADDGANAAEEWLSLPHTHTHNHTYTHTHECTRAHLQTVGPTLYPR